jgi:hypothetical protein
MHDFRQYFAVSAKYKMNATKVQVEEKKVGQDDKIFKI